jgi:hypothetical protein
MKRDTTRDPIRMAGTCAIGSEVRPRAGRLVAVLTAAVLTISGSLFAAETRGNVTVGLLFGYDTNPLLIMDDGPDGGFTELRVGGAFSVTFRPVVTLFLDGNGALRRFGSSYSGANRGGGRAQLGLSFAPVQGSPGKMALAVGGLYAIDRTTFNDRVTGEAFEILPDPNDPLSAVAIPDRFSVDTSGAFLDYRWRPMRSFRVLFRGQLEKNDFVEDYTETGVLHSLDNTAIILEPAFQYQVNRMMAFTVSFILTDIEYVDRPALDLDGFEVDGTTREYRSAEYRLEILVSPARNTFVNFGVRSGDRSDLYAGYYDFNARTAFLSVDQNIGKRSRVRVSGSMLKVDYDRAIVPGTIEEAIRGSEIRRYVARYDYVFHRNVGLFFEGGVQRNDNQDPIFAFDRDWVLTGIEFRR